MFFTNSVIYGLFKRVHILQPCQQKIGNTSPKRQCHSTETQLAAKVTLLVKIPAYLTKKGNGFKAKGVKEGGAPANFGRYDAHKFIDTLSSIFYMPVYMFS